MTSSIIIRIAAMAEQKALEALQLRASLTNDGDREALLANPDAIKIPLEQLAAGRVFVSELSGVTVGFSAIEPRVDGETELDALFVEPNIRRRGIGRLMVEYCAEVARKWTAHRLARMPMVTVPALGGILASCISAWAGRLRCADHTAADTSGNQSHLYSRFNLGFNSSVNSYVRIRPASDEESSCHESF